MPRRIRLVLYIIIPLVVLSIFSSTIFEWLWMRQVGYEGVFWTLKLTKVSLGVLAFAISGVFLVANARMLAGELRWATFEGTPFQEIELNLGEPKQYLRVKKILTGVALFFALLFALTFYLGWDESLRFLWNEPFGQIDPIFGKDLGFYMFQLPFWEMIQTSFALLVFLTLLFLLGVYWILRLMTFGGMREGLSARKNVRTHLKLNAALWLLLLAFGLFLDRFQILFSSQGIVFGAGYTDVNIVLPALWIALVMVALLAVFLVVSTRRRVSRRMMGGAIGVAVLAWVLGRMVLPGVVQQFIVEPNELELETPYLEHNIAMTRLAYNLHEVTEVEYEASDTLRIDDIQRNRDAVDNIRLWDPRLLIQTYKQLQEIRSYYEFFSVDNDRYEYGGDVKQVMVSAREISTDLPGEANWVNRRLQFTHGYGLAMSPVTEMNRQGEPILVVKDLPPDFGYEELTVDNPAIYYGEEGGGHYIVNTGIQELHYPSGDENVYNSYEGQGGLPFSSLFHRLLYAWELSDVNILFSDYIHSESRLQVWRGVQERIQQITPFLELDHDPYLVLGSGRLYWVQDAYTTSRNFPYSQPFREFNYIRNSVKITVDAYDGAIDYYVVDDQDPVLHVYRSIFPNLFKAREEMPPELERHFRYPQDLFEIQLERFNRYHMTNPQVFYNNEDLWTRPFEKYGGQQLIMEPYYVLARLPAAPDDTGAEGARGPLEFMLISPLTPENRDNMISWMAAKSDPEEYGRLVVYKLPKQRLIYGPAQIEARIDQDPEISQQLALWDQRGSRVIRGNLMVIPVENSFLYVEPVFLLAEGVDIPQLQRVIVAFGDDIAMEPTLDESLFELFGAGAAPEAVVSREQAPDSGEAAAAATPVVSADDLERVRALWNRLRGAFESGDWTQYGEVMEELDRAIGE